MTLPNVKACGPLLAGSVITQLNFMNGSEWFSGKAAH